MGATIRLTARRRPPHPWLHAGELTGELPAESALVRVLDAGGRDLGAGCYSVCSRIRLRLCGPWPGRAAPVPEEFFGQRIAKALERRGASSADAGVRLVHGDADGLPGLVVDRYADCLVVQVTAAAVERHLDCVVPPLVEATGARMVLARNDVAARRFEGLPSEVRLLHGRRVERVEIVEHGVVHPVDLFEGHKTGFYLDQRPARARLRGLAAGARVLDLFSYQGAFSLAALASGASEALAVDQSEAALQRAREAADRNRLHGLRTRRANVFDLLRQLRHGDRRWDLMILDPPPFAPSRRAAAGGLRGYRDLNRQALRLLAPGGYLLTCSCSHHVSPPMFEGVLRQAAAGLPFRMMLVERLMAGADHPVWLRLPESEYLKVVLLQRDPASD